MYVISQLILMITLSSNEKRTSFDYQVKDIHVTSPWPLNFNAYQIRVGVSNEINEEFLVTQYLSTKHHIQIIFNRSKLM